MKTKVQKWGNSLALRIPKSFATEVRIVSGSEVDLQIKDGVLTVIPGSQKLTLKALLKTVTPENIHDETDTGDSQGGESW